MGKDSLASFIGFLLLLFGCIYPLSDGISSSSGSSGSRAYAESPIIFSPDGRILQLDAASAAIERGSLMLVITTKNCQDVLLLFATKTDGSPSKLHMSSPNQLYRIDESRKDVELLLCATGWVPDSGMYYNYLQLLCTILLLMY